MAGTAYRTVQAIEADTASDLRIDGQRGRLPSDHAPRLRGRRWRPCATSGRLRGCARCQVDVQDVYDEFGYGITGAVAIHDFLAYAYGNWQAPAPSYVVLVGDGNYDPKNYLGYGRTATCRPTWRRLIPWIGETAADNRYVTLVGEDTLPDMMLGRLSVNSSAEASAFVDQDRGLRAEPGARRLAASRCWRWPTTPTARATSPSISEHLLSAYLPAPYQAQKVYYGVTHTTPAPPGRPSWTGSTPAS